MTGSAGPQLSNMPQAETRKRLGRVVAHSGTDVLIMLSAHQDDRPILRIGSVVLLGEDPSPIVGLVAGINAPAPGMETDGPELWIAQIELHGTLHAGASHHTLERAVKTPPTLGDAAYEATSNDLSDLYRNGLPGALPIGDVFGAKGIDATLDADALCRGGFAIIGAGGSGKSSTLVTLERALLRTRYQARALLIDPYNEYGRSFGKAATVLKPQNGLFPHWLLTFEELCWVLSINGGGMDSEEQSILEEAIPVARQRFAQRQNLPRSGKGVGGVDAVTLDGPIPYRTTDLIAHIDSNLHSDNTRSTAAFKRLRNRIMGAIADPRLNAIFGSATAADTLSGLIKKLFCLDPQTPPLAILQLGTLMPGLDQLLVGVVARLAAAVAEWGATSRKILLLIEDAERYAPAIPKDQAAELSLAAINHLGGRARRLGVSVGLTASHPRDVDRTLLARAGTMFLHRMPSTLDVEAVEDLLPEAAPAVLSGLGSFGEREVVAIGRAVPLATRMTITELPAGAIPADQPMGPSSRGDAQVANGDEVELIVSRWRNAGDAEAE